MASLLGSLASGLGGAAEKYSQYAQQDLNRRANEQFQRSIAQDAQANRRALQEDQQAFQQKLQEQREQTTRELRLELQNLQGSQRTDANQFSAIQDRYKSLRNAFAKAIQPGEDIEGNPIPVSPAQKRQAFDQYLAGLANLKREFPESTLQQAGVFQEVNEAWNALNPQKEKQSTQTGALPSPSAQDALYKQLNDMLRGGGQLGGGANPPPAQTPPPAPLLQGRATEEEKARAKQKSLLLSDNALLYGN